MARTYAAIMALVAMLVVLLRALKNQSGCEETVLLALAWMSVFASAGFILGAIARHTVDQSVLTMIEAELNALNSSKENTASEAAS